jgi:hypothetical protein
MHPEVSSFNCNKHMLASLEGKVGCYATEDEAALSPNCRAKLSCSSQQMQEQHMPNQLHLLLL